ncbi:MAG TPA: tannase/feruloyl esterase family alpha/beta hydrolase [Paludibaculum sp.]
MTYRALAPCLLVAASLTAQAASSCENLAALKLPATTIQLAQTIAAGAFTPPSGPATLYKALPAFCRVTGSIHPTADSDIRFEVWMPETGWNSRFQGVGNGGFAGSLSLGAMAIPVVRGYATATTDTGHSGNDASWAVGHPEKVIDYGYRAVHEMTVTAKAVITAFYGAAPKHSYFSSCSNGGRQALMEAQRYPADYDGIVAGAPANDFTHVAAGFAWNQLALLADPASYIPAVKMAAVEKAALAACDARDGLADGLIDNPHQCRFDPGTLLCSGAESDSCLTAPQVATLRKIYSGPKTAQGKAIFPGFLPGGESGAGGWPGWINGMAPEKSAQFFFFSQMFGNMVVEDPAWNYKSFRMETDLPRLEKKLNTVLNATDVNLTPFVARGGKLILYHGWCDAALTALNTIDYYKKAAAKVGSKRAASSLRLYLVPGMQHCSGGAGTDEFWGLHGAPSDAQHDLTKAVEAWVEEGRAPSEIIASKITSGKVLRTRPLCPYPQVARYKGAGSVDDAASFACGAGR